MMKMVGRILKENATSGSAFRNTRVLKSTIMLSAAVMNPMTASVSKVLFNFSKKI